MPDSMTRHWHLLKLIPRHPARIDTSTLEAKLADDGFAVDRRTIERDLVKLSKIFDIEADQRQKPYGWSWSPVVRGCDSK